MNAPAHPVTPCNDSKVKKVATLLQELKRASLRPLYIEITIHKRRIEQQHVVIAPASDNYESNRFTSNESVPIIPDANRSWVEVNYLRDSFFFKMRELGALSYSLPFVYCYCDCLFAYFGITRFSKMQSFYLRFWVRMSMGKSYDYVQFTY
jgi:hypothetical protein